MSSRDVDLGPGLYGQRVQRVTFNLGREVVAFEGDRQAVYSQLGSFIRSRREAELNDEELASRDPRGTLFDPSHAQGALW